MYRGSRPVVLNEQNKIKIINYIIRIVIFLTLRYGRVQTASVIEFQKGKRTVMAKTVFVSSLETL